MNFKTMSLDDLMNWCIVNKQVKWLKEISAKKIKDKKTGVMREITFFELKIAFAKKFMPEILPKKQPKAPTMWERIAALEE